MFYKIYQNSCKVKGNFRHFPGFFPKCKTIVNSYKINGKISGNMHKMPIGCGVFWNHFPAIPAHGTGVRQPQDELNCAKMKYSEFFLAKKRDATKK